MQRTAVGMLVVVAIIMVIFGKIRLNRDRLAYEHGRIADITWHEEGNPGVISCTVVDTNGVPIKGLEVAFRNNSGGNSAFTDQTGSTKVHVAERELEQIKLNGVVVLSRPRAYYVNYPSVDRGLTVRIVVKSKGEIGVR